MQGLTIELVFAKHSQGFVDFRAQVDLIGRADEALQQEACHIGLARLSQEVLVLLGGRLVGDEAVLRVDVTDVGDQLMH